MYSTFHILLQMKKKERKKNQQKRLKTSVIRVETNIFFFTLIIKEALWKKCNNKTGNKNGPAGPNNTVNNLDGGIKDTRQICIWHQTGGSIRKSGYTQGKDFCPEKTPSQRDEYTKALCNSWRNAKSCPRNDRPTSRGAALWGRLWGSSRTSGTWATTWLLPGLR